VVLPNQPKKSRKYHGTLKFPVTPARKDKDLRLTLSPTHLSLPTHDSDMLNV
jgi:hypothetical protein